MLGEGHKLTWTQVHEGKGMCTQTLPGNTIGKSHNHLPTH